jgi:hypothetical protein
VKTEAEILARIEAVKKDDWLGTMLSDLVHYLPYNAAKPFLKEGITEEQWAKSISDVLPPIEAIKDYLPFAWDKANNQRGISAGRSIDHIRTWLWLAGYGTLVDTEFKEYEYYGKRLLVIASIISGFDWKEHDDGDWSNGDDDSLLSIEERLGEVEEATRIARKAMGENG